MYTLERFGTTTLPVARPALTVGTPSSQTAVTATAIGGGYDSLGSETGRGKPFTVNYNCTLYSTSGETTIQTQFDALKALIGKRDHLYRRMPDGNVQWVNARLVNVDATRTINNTNFLDISMTFQVAEYPWKGDHHGAGWVLDDGIYFDTGYTFDEATGYYIVPLPAAGTIEIYNNGNYPVRNAIISIDAAGTNITEVVLQKTNETDLKYAGTILAGQSLEINCGAFSVLNKGVDDFANFSREAGHFIAEWVVLDPGLNTFTTSRTGGSASSAITFTFSDGWA